ncbi:MAG TPA: hypothetical protein VF634_06140, partial [Pyrinomonadaceae bacterium]
ERLLGLDARKAGAKNDALSYLEKLLTSPNSPPAAPSHPPRNQNFAAPADAINRPAQNLAAQRQAAPSSPATWERVEIEPGLELHVRGDYASPADAKEVRRLTRLILNALEVQRGNSGR